MCSNLLRAESLRLEGKLDAAIQAVGEARAIADVWFGHLELARVYEAGKDAARAEAELKVCVARKGEGALASFNPSRTSLRYLAEADARLARIEARRP